MAAFDRAVSDSLPDRPGTRQGEHVVGDRGGSQLMQEYAQKSTRTTFPLSDPRSIGGVFSHRSMPEIAGAVPQFSRIPEPEPASPRA
jgi:hypothetical protein